jgi:tetratricopeptide (TPR) repeat protein
MMSLALLAVGASQAQEAPAEEPAETEKLAIANKLLTSQELAMWQAYMRGDSKACYTDAQALLEAPSGGDAEFRIALALQRKATGELGWHKAHVSDLTALIELHEGSYLQELARWELIEALRRANRLNEIQAHADKLGMIRNWWVMGPFANDRGAAFEEELEPEENLDLSRDYTGKNGQKVSLRELPTKPTDGTIDIGAMYRPNKEVCALAFTAVWCDEDETTVKVSIGSTHSYGTCWIEDYDGETLFSIDDINDVERELGFDQESRTYILKKGWSVFAMKLGVSSGPWAFRVRMTGNTRVANSTDEFNEAMKDLPEDWVDGPDNPFGRFKSDRGTIIRATRELLAPNWDRTTRMPAKSFARVLETLDKTTHPEEYAVLSYLAAWANRSSARAAAGREENKRREYLTMALELDPKAARAAHELAQYYASTFRNPALADRYGQMAVTANPDWPDAALFAARVKGMKGMPDEVERVLTHLRQQHPGNGNLLRFAAYYAGLRRDYRLSNELMTRALAINNADDYAREILLGRAVASGDITAALKYSRDTRKLEPFDTSSRMQMAKLFASKAKYSLAVKELKAALKIAPRDDEVLEQLGETYNIWADESEGIESNERRLAALNAYQAALEANPNRSDLERYLEFLDGEQPVFEAKLQLDIHDLITETLKTPVTSDDPYEVIFRGRVTVVNKDGTSTQYMQVAYRVANDDGRDQLQSVRTPTYAGQRGRCVHACLHRKNGDAEIGRRGRFGASFAAPQIGDIVHLRFRVADVEQSFFGEFYGDIEVLGDYVPVRRTRLSWVLPKGREFYSYRTLNAPERVETEVEGQRVWTWDVKNLPKIPDEPLAPSSVQAAPSIQISTYENWKDFGKWYYNLIRKQMEPTPEMRAEVEAITNGLTTERDKARAVYNWVVTKVRYNADWHFGVHGYKPFSAGAVFGRAIGDCKDKAILICTMMKIAGVKAYPVIINLENFRGAEDITLPMPHHFNHAIAFIEYSDGQNQFVDGTTTYHGFDELPSGDAGANVIVVKPDGGVKMTIPVPAADADNVHDEVQVSFTGNKTLKLSVSRTAKGDSAASVRARFQREGDRKRLLESEWSKHYPGAKVTDISANNLESLNETPELKFSVTLPNAYSAKGFRVALNPRRWSKTEYAKLSERKTAMLMTTPFSRTSRWVFTLPAGKKLAALPTVFERRGDNAEFTVNAEMKDGKLIVTRRYALGGKPVAPADYKQFRDDLISFDNAEQQTIGWKN